ncbi:chemotaxis protein CheB [Alicyclobacillus acidocaldarius]|uniref:Signal transduction histidine kinase with CheB and CheR activity n=1 Tax=Alicyclobacillus acidocaldarius subsp. acidocaldarius (strain ATCC 27009 / DSM 446 / BCRC 14685 / JCM 5260 / KCTC 1825 / NBRC 15652 / NCIMB 11725 / NRRL B-14509 / 104-IA) TaxID=521098 RepID=C8WTH9_ALIAD|nr:chemotaxis protein CheB [Alicyclobacillus acidocaldarius]ACV57721.1 signal transduction histidine kinase with CheB and CheR activity [Alicyclobacillus acidocaldarius subsp. acidocaldarius DSM 446]
MSQPHDLMRVPLYVVGIGASAGGLEALTNLFDKLAPDTGMAFVVIQHLSPNYRSFMAELLGAHTSMPVLQAEDGMPLEPNRVYLNPPRKNVFVDAGRLVVQDHLTVKGELHLPIDGCLQSIAEYAGDRAVAVILSGTGSDGSRGIVRVKQRGGRVFVQDETAKFDGMPKSAVATGTVDAVLSPDAIAKELERIARGEQSVSTFSPPSVTIEDDGHEELDDARYQELLEILKSSTGIDYTVYKRDGVIRRLRRRMGIENISDVNHYFEALRQNPDAVEALHKDLLIGVTRFFRDPQAFQVIYQDVLPQIFANRQTEREVRVWVAGCSTGEEAYSLAILIQEFMESIGQIYNVKIFATDLDRDAVAFASNGVYGTEIQNDVSAERLRKFFVPCERGYRVKPDIRKMIIFAPHNITKDPPFINTDLISCRNMIIYLRREIQEKVLSLFHFALHPKGFLFLGPSESIGRMSNSFVPINTKWNIYQHQGASCANRRPIIPPVTVPVKSASLPASHMVERRVDADSWASSRQADPHTDELYRVFVEEHFPPCIVLDEKNDVVSMHGDVNRYLSLASGRPSNHIHKMFPPSISVAIATGVSKLKKGSREVIYDRVKVNDSPDSATVTLVIRQLSDRLNRFRSHALVMFREPEPLEAVVYAGDDVSSTVSQRVIELERELQMYQEKLQVTVEELETSNEELQATNEEIVAANEELQSTNEELHSVNEELLTINAEYQLNIQQLTELTNDLDNFLASTEIGTLFLERELKVKRFTPALTKEFHLLDIDVGRPITHISHRLEYDEMIDDAKSVLANGEPIEREVHSKSGAWYAVRVLPYHTPEQAVKGVVFTFVDITKIKKMNEELRKLSYAVEQSPSIVVITDTEGRIEYVNPKFCACTGSSVEEALGRHLRDLNEWAEQNLSFDDVWSNLQAGERWTGEVPSRRKDGTLYWEQLSIVPILDETGRIIHYLKVAEDVTEFRYTEELLRKSEMLSAVGELAAGIAHEIRNPLTALKGFTKLILSGSHSDSYLEIMRGELDRIETIVNELLVLSKPQAVHIQRRNFADILRDVVMLLETQALLTHVDIELRIPDEPIEILCVENQLKQVFINLLKNAIEAMPNGGTIEVTVERDGDHVVIRVRDEGVGIPQDKMKKLGEPFYTTKDKGTGLGLMVSFKIVEQHGGIIRYESKEGEGTTVTVRLPLDMNSKARGLTPGDLNPGTVYA